MLAHRVLLVNIIYIIRPNESGLKRGMDRPRVRVRAAKNAPAPRVVSREPGARGTDRRTSGCRLRALSWAPVRLHVPRRRNRQRFNFLAVGRVRASQRARM